MTPGKVPARFAREFDGEGFPTAPASSIPAVTSEQMREIDREAVEGFDLLLIQMMENAGVRLAELALRRFQPETVAVLCGRAGNGGGGLVAARHLANRGVRVAVTLGKDRSRLGDVPRHQLAILQRMAVPIGTEPVAAGLVLDALIGYSLRGDPHGRAAELIRWANEHEAPVCSLDVPSGLDATTGEIGDPCVRAMATLTLALPKTGLAGAPGVVGELYLADISIPPALYSNIATQVDPIFASGPILRLV
ncbi:MAG: NAD(P)H-hydrate epimerase [Actinomycetota bacterium]